MDRRVLAAVALLAVAIAVGLGMWLGPSVEPEGEARVAAPKNSATRPSAKAPSTGRSAADPSAPVARAEPRTPTPPWDAPEETDTDEPPEEAPRGTLAVRCQALQVKTNALDDLMTFEDEAAEDPAKRALLAVRVAQLSMSLLDDSEALRSGEMTCTGAPELDLGGAAEFLARNLPELETDEESLASVDDALQALSEID